MATSCSRPEVEIWRSMAGAIQCYSCKVTASNEIEANVRCLETANLEDCSEFYQYYRSVYCCCAHHHSSVYTRLNTATRRDGNRVEQLYANPIAVVFDRRPRVARRFEKRYDHWRQVTRFWATVCKTVRPMLSDRCLSCLSVTLVYSVQTVGWIKMKLGTEVGLGTGHSVLDGDPAASLPKGHSPHFSGHVYCGQTVAHLSYC